MLLSYQLVKSAIHWIPLLIFRLPSLCVCAPFLNAVPRVRCVELVINEQIRRYNEKMEEIEQLEYAETLAVNQLKLKRQNTVRPGPPAPETDPASLVRSEHTPVKPLMSAILIPSIKSRDVPIPFFFPFRFLNYQPIQADKVSSIVTTNITYYYLIIIL